MENLNFQIEQNLIKFYKNNELKGITCRDYFDTLTDEVLKNTFHFLSTMFDNYGSTEKDVLGTGHEGKVYGINEIYALEEPHRSDREQYGFKEFFNLYTAKKTLQKGEDSTLDIRVPTPYFSAENRLLEEKVDGCHVQNIDCVNKALYSIDFSSRYNDIFRKLTDDFNFSVRHYDKHLEENVLREGDTFYLVDPAIVEN